MFAEIPQTLILFSTAAFIVGWILSAISSRMTSKFQVRKRDPRDVRIRSLEAELRVARAEAEKSGEKGDDLDTRLQDASEGIEKRDNVILHQQERIEELTADLKGSVLKTRELRSELSERATESIKSEIKIREVETELEVAQASTDMIATGVLDYSLAPDAEDGKNDENADDADDADFSKAAT